MLDFLFDILGEIFNSAPEAVAETTTAAAVGAGAGLIAAGVGYLLATCIKNASKWFAGVWRSLSRVKRGAGLLVRIGTRLFKRLVVEKITGEEEHYEDENDQGVEVSTSEIPAEFRADFEKYGCLVVETFEN